MLGRRASPQRLGVWQRQVLEHTSLSRSTPSTAGNSMTGSERPSPEPLLKKRGVPSRTGGGDNSGNALEASNALNYGVWGIPAVLLTESPRRTGGVAHLSTHALRCHWGQNYCIPCLGGGGVNSFR